MFTAVHVNCVLRSLRQFGLVDFRSSTVVALDHKALAASGGIPGLAAWAGTRRRGTSFGAKENATESDVCERGPFAEAGMVSAESGEVMVEGPDGVALSLTPEAAELFVRRQIDAAEDACRQQSLARESD